MKKIKVQLDFNISKKTHTLYESFFNNPPEGVVYIKSDFRGINKKNYSFFGKIYKKVVSIFPFVKKFHQNLTDFLRRDSDSDLAYLSFHLGKTKKRVVIDYETAYTFIKNREKLKKERKKAIRLLNKGNIKYLLPINGEVLRSFKLFFGNSVKKPQEIIYPTIFIAEKNRKKVKKEKLIVFIGSANVTNDKAFYVKGGYETLKSFEKLSKKYPNYKFLIVSHIPSKIKIKPQKNLIIKDILPQKELWKLLNRAQIFVQPNYHAPAMAYLEAMWFKLPIITYNCWGNPEFVDNKNGILLNPEEINHIDNNNVPQYTKEILKNIRKNSGKNSKKIEKVVEKLIKNEKLRKQMGEEGYNKVIKGKFSIKERNRKLRKIYEEILKNG